MGRPLAALRPPPAPAWGLWLALHALGCGPPAVEVPPPTPGLPLDDRPAWAQRRARIIARVGELERAVARRVADEQLPGAAMGLVVDGRLIWGRGYGRRSLSDGGAVQPHSVFAIGSITKVVTAMAILRLRDEGRLGLDQPAALWLPALDRVRAPTDDAGPITLRHLLTHTSGLPTVGRLKYSDRDDGGPGEGEILSGLEGLALLSVPGTRHRYSNLGYALLGLVVARASGVRYRDYVSNNVLLPLGMYDARWSFDEVPAAQRMTGYAGSPGRFVAAAPWQMGEAEGMGGLLASLDDLVRLVTFQMSAWPPGTRPDLAPLRNATLRESHFLAGFQPLDRQGTGLGWGVAKKGGHRLNFHAGETNTFSASVSFYPDRRVGVIGLASCACTKSLSRLETTVMAALVPVL